MRASARGLVLLFLVTSCVQAAPPLSAETMRQRQESKARFDRSVAEMERTGEQRWKEMQARQSQINQKMQQDFQRAYAARHPSTQLPPFNPATAPPPAACLLSFIAAARTATAMEQVLPYLPVDEQQTLLERQSQYDPQIAASGRAWHKQQNPKINGASLTYLSNPPFTNELDRNKRIATGILDILLVKVERNKALIGVATNKGGIVNGIRYPYGIAEVEMLGEANYWKIASYNDSNVVFLKSPQPPDKFSKVTLVPSRLPLRDSAAASPALHK